MSEVSIVIDHSFKDELMTLIKKKAILPYGFTGKTTLIINWNNGSVGDIWFNPEIKIHSQIKKNNLDIG